MAWYKWLDSDMYDPVWNVKWPELGESQQMEICRFPLKGFQVYPGSRVCSSIPWRHVPVDLYQIDVDGEYLTYDGQVFFTEVVPAKKLGTLNADVAPQLALAWLDKLIEGRFGSDIYLQPELAWDKDILLSNRDRIADGVNGRCLVPIGHIRATGNKWLIYTASVATAKTPEEAWCYTLYLADEASNPTMGLEFARVLDSFLEGAE